MNRILKCLIFGLSALTASSVFAAQTTTMNLDCSGTFHGVLKHDQIIVTITPGVSANVKVTGDANTGISKEMSLNQDRFSKVDTALQSSQYQGSFTRTGRDYPAQLTLQLWPVGTDGMLVRLNVCDNDCGIYAPDSTADAYTADAVRPDFLCTVK